MKKFLIVLLALTLAGCSALAPVPQPTLVPPTAQVIVQTVMVMITPTPLPPTPIPLATIAPTDTPVSAPTSAALPTAGSAAGGALTIPNISGGGVFINISVSGDYFSLRCYPKELTFNVTAADIHIFNVEFYYRIADKNSVDISEWKNGGLMQPDRSGGFSLVFSAESIHPDWRRAQTAFDFQFVGVNKTGEVVGRTERIIGLINYSNDCP